MLMTSSSLHDLELVGIDTCSAVSVSTEAEDFLYIDDSPEAKESVTLNGVGRNEHVNRRAWANGSACNGR